MIKEEIIQHFTKACALTEKVLPRNHLLWKYIHKSRITHTSGFKNIDQVLGQEQNN